jgi:hypothetical protein
VICGRAISAGAGPGGGGTAITGTGAALAASTSSLSALRSICSRHGPSSPSLARQIGEGFLTPKELAVQSSERRQDCFLGGQSAT